MQVELPQVSQEPQASLQSAAGLRDARSPFLSAAFPLQSDTALLRELELARRIQQSQCPNEFPQLPGFGVAGFSLGARPLQGDFFDVLRVGSGAVLLVVADVMGKGVPGALIAATARAWVRTLAGSALEPGALLRRLNQVIYPELDAVDMFITMQLALVDTQQDVLTLAGAGHGPVIVGDRTGSLRTLSPRGMPLGIVQDADYTGLTLPLNDISCALLFTDGLTEATNLSGETFGLRRFTSWLARLDPTLLTASQFCAKFRSELLAFQEHDTLKDDQTLLMFLREPAWR